MTEEIIKECKNCDALGIDSEIGVYYCCLSHRQDDLPKEFTCNDFTPNKQLRRLEQERNESKKKYEDVANENLKEIYELIKKNDCWRGVVNVVCSKLEQENEELKELNKKICEDWEKEIKVYWNALEKIRDLCIHYKNTNDKCVINCYAHFIVTDLIQDKINEVLNEK